MTNQSPKFVFVSPWPSHFDLALGRDDTPSRAESSLRRVLSVASGLPCYPDAETLSIILHFWIPRK